MDKDGPDNKAIFYLTYLGGVTDQITAMQVDQAKTVDCCREHGASWRMIGVALGTTTQSAWERFRNPDPPRARGGDPTLWD